MILVGDCLHNHLVNIGEEFVTGIHLACIEANFLAAAIAADRKDGAAHDGVGNLGFIITGAATFNGGASLVKLNLDSSIGIGTAAQSNSSRANIFLLLAFGIRQGDGGTDGQAAVNRFIHADDQLTILVDAGAIDSRFDDLPLDVVEIANVVAQFGFALHDAAVIAIQEHFALVGGNSQVAGYIELCSHNVDGTVIRHAGGAADGEDVIFEAFKRIAFIGNQMDAGSIGVYTLEVVVNIDIRPFPVNIISRILLGISSKGQLCLLANNGSGHFGNVEVRYLLHAGHGEHSVNHIFINVVHFSARHNNLGIGHGITGLKAERDLGSIDSIGQEAAVVVQFSRQTALQPLDAALTNLVNADRGGGRNAFNRLGHIQRDIQSSALHSCQSGGRPGAGIIFLALHRNGDALAGKLFVNH